MPIKEHDSRRPPYVVPAQERLHFRCVDIHPDDSHLSPVLLFKGAHGAVDGLTDESIVRVKLNQGRLVERPILCRLQIRNVARRRLAVLLHSAQRSKATWLQID